MGLLLLENEGSGAVLKEPTKVSEVKVVVSIRYKEVWKTILDSNKEYQGLVPQALHA